MKKTRGKKMVLTTAVKDDLPRFRSDFLDAEKWFIPMLVLYGLKEKCEVVYPFDLAEQFLRDPDKPNVYEDTISALSEYAEYVNEKDPGRFLATLTGGLSFDRSDELNDFHASEELFSEYDLDEYSIGKYLFLGAKDKNWYEVTRRDLTKILIGYDIELFVKLFAITSPRTNFKANLVLALRAYDIFKNNQSISSGKFLPSVRSMLVDFKKGKFAFTGAERNGRRKVSNFARALLGDSKAVVVDSWLLRAYGLSESYLWKGGKMPHKPRVTEYDIIERHICMLADTCEYEPRQIVAMLWKGIRTSNSNHKVTSAKKLLMDVLA